MNTTTNPNVQVRGNGKMVRLELYMPEHDDWLVVSLTLSHARTFRQAFDCALAEVEKRLADKQEALPL